MRCLHYIACLALAGCGGGGDGYAVDLTVIGDPSISDMALASVKTLDVAVSGAQSGAKSYPLAKPFATGRAERLIVRPSVAGGGALLIAATARDAMGNAVGYGAVKVALAPGGTVAATVTLVARFPGVEVIAGAPGGRGSLDGVGPAARFYSPHGVVAAGGFAYVADSGNALIRRVDLGTGEVVAFAGQAHVPGIVDGRGAAALFSYPLGLALGADGKILVADAYVNSIRRIDPQTAEVTTLVTDDLLDHASAVAITADGKTLYVSAEGSHSIVAVDVLAGRVAAFAGTGMAGDTDGPLAGATFETPNGLALDGQGGLFVVDYVAAAATVRRIDLAQRTITTLAGMYMDHRFIDGSGATARFDRPRGAAFLGGKLYVAGGDDGLIRVVTPGADPTSTMVATFSGKPPSQTSVDGPSGTARYNIPWGLFSDGGQRLLLTEEEGCTLRSVDLAGAVTTVAGNGGQPGYADGKPSASRLFAPISVAVDGDGAIWISDFYGGLIRKIDAATGEVSTLRDQQTGMPVGIAGPRQLALDGAGGLYVVIENEFAVRKLTLATGASALVAGGTKGSADGTGAAAQLFEPYGLVLDGKGAAFIADAGNHTLRRLDLASGAVTTVAGTAGAIGATDGVGAAARLDQPGQLALGADGAIYFPDSHANRVRRFDPATGAVTTIAGADPVGSADGTGSDVRFNSPEGIVADGNVLWIADSGNGTLRRLDPATSAVTTRVGAAGEIGVRAGPLATARLNYPIGLALTPAHDLIVASFWENVILRVRAP